MPYGLIDYDTLNNIAKAIRYKANSNAQYYPRDMATAINGIRSGGGLDEPTFYSLQQFYQYYYDQSSFPSLYEFEITNNNIGIESKNFYHSHFSTKVSFQFDFNSASLASVYSSNIDSTNQRLLGSSHTFNTN